MPNDTDYYGKCPCGKAYCVRHYWENEWQDETLSVEIDCPVCKELYDYRPLTEYDYKTGQHYKVFRLFPTEAVRQLARNHVTKPEDMDYTSYIGWEEDGGWFVGYPKSDGDEINFMDWSHICEELRRHGNAGEPIRFEESALKRLRDGGH